LSRFGIGLIFDLQTTMNAPLAPCVFCRIEPDAIQLENALAFAILDDFPVTPLHALIISKRHIPDYFSLTESEQMACNELLSRLRAKILADHVDILRRQASRTPRCFERDDKNVIGP
jgi:hypothetical protein